MQVLHAPHPSNPQSSSFGRSRAACRGLIATHRLANASSLQSMQHGCVLLLPATHIAQDSCSSRPRRAHVCTAQQGPDKGSVAALEAALGAINNILGTYNKVRGPGKATKQGTGITATAGNGKQAVAGAPSGPSKLISFCSKASSSVPVKELLKATSVQQDSSNNQPRTQHHSKSHKHHKHSSHKPSNHKGSSTSNGWLQQLTGQQSNAHNLHTMDSSGEPLPQEALNRSLQAYLALPLEQYSVLDPKLITRLPPGTDVEATLADMLAGQRAKRAANKAQQQQQQQGGLDAVLAGSTSSSSSSGTSMQPVLRELHASAAAESNGTSTAIASSSNSSSVSSNGTGSSDSSTTAAAATATAASSGAAVLPEDGAGAFLLRIPMKELLGVDLEPLLVIYVDIDPKHAQVTFSTNRLVIGDPRFDQEFKVDLVAKLSSKVSQPATLLTPAADTTAADSTAAVSVSTAAHTSLTSSSAGNTADEHSSSSSSMTTVVQDTATTLAEAAAIWQRNSALSCKVKLGMTLRLPHPLSIVPGPLLSTTASLVARLVMQALLPSFLELLATDYGRWASGSSTAARQALPAGSLVAAGKEHLQQVKEQHDQRDKVAPNSS